MKSVEMERSAAPRWLIIASFAAIYIIWGSTYLGIKYAIETLPPFLMAGIRFFLAGLILYIIALFQQTPAATPAQWKSSAIIGGLLLFAGNGVVVWAEHFIDSGTAALLITIEPVWVIVLLWVFARKKPSFKILLAISLAVVGMILLVGPSSLKGLSSVDIRGVSGIVFATFAWAVGSIYTVKADIPASPVQATALQMITGGAMLLAGGSMAGEWSSVQPQNFSDKSMWAFLYLVVFGSLVGYTAYSFLLKHATPSQVSTYAYVNPVIAVYLGWALADETISSQTLLASGLLVGAVTIITRFSEKA